MSLAAARAPRPAITRRGPSFTSHSPRPAEAPSEPRSHPKSESLAVGQSPGHSPRPAAARLTGNRRGPPLFAAARPAVTYRGPPSLAAARVTRRGPSHSLRPLTAARLCCHGPCPSLASARVTLRGPPSHSPRPESLRPASLQSFGLATLQPQSLRGPEATVTCRGPSQGHSPQPAVTRRGPRHWQSLRPDRPRRHSPACRRHSPQGLRVRDSPRPRHHHSPRPARPLASGRHESLVESLAAGRVTRRPRA